MTSVGGKLHVGLDGFNLAMPKGTGIATYARSLSHCLADAGHQVDVLYGMNIAQRASPLMREMVFFDSLERDLLRRAPAPLSAGWWRERLTAARAIEVPITGRVVREAFAGRMPGFERILNATDLFRRADRYFRRTGKFLPVQVARPPSIMHWTYPLPITVAGARNIYTLHDLIPLRLPYTTLDDKGYYLRLIRGCLRYGDHICTVSEASRSDIISLFQVPAERVTNTYQAIVDPPGEATEADIADHVRGVFNLPFRDYFLFFGAIEPKKNVGRIIEAYLSARLTTPLVLVGGAAWRSEQELRLIEGEGASFGDGALVRRIDYLPVAMLMRLVRGAKAVLFPSLYEGFGLPVLEAMTLGTPVLTSNTAALPEIGGDATLAVDPYNIRALTEALRRLDSDAELRSDMVARGRLQAERFSRASYRQRLEAMYQAINSG